MQANVEITILQIISISNIKSSVQIAQKQFNRRHN